MLPIISIIGVPRIGLGPQKFLRKHARASGRSHWRSAENRTRASRTRNVYTTTILHSDNENDPKTCILPLYYTPIMEIIPPRVYCRYTILRPIKSARAKRVYLPVYHTESTRLLYGN